MGSEGLEPSRLIKSSDFKSDVSTIPPRPLARRRHPDLNWGMKDLQSKALPLGYTALIILIRFGLYLIKLFQEKQIINNNLIIIS